MAATETDTADTRSIQARGIPLPIHSQITGYRGGARISAGEFVQRTWKLREILLREGLDQYLDEAGLGRLPVQ